MTQLRTLIVHPDPLLRRDLRALLKACPFLRVCGEAVAALEALELFEAAPYAVFFLGVRLESGESGFETAQMLLGRKDSPALVFLAPDESEAFRAFELGAVDYLLWPSSPDRLERTFARLRQFRSHYNLAPSAPPPRRLPEPTPEERRTKAAPLETDEETQFLSALKQAWDHSKRFPPAELDKLAVTVDDKTILIPFERISFIEAYEDYTYVHTATDKFLTSHRLKNLEERLRDHRFFRVHRKYLVNLDMVAEVAADHAGGCVLRTAGRTSLEVPVSRRRLAEVKAMLGF